MAKTNFTKVEDALSAGLWKMKLSSLDKLAGVAQKLGKPEFGAMAEQVYVAANKTIVERNATLFVVRNGVKSIKDKKFYEEIGITRDDLTKMVENPKTLQPEDLKKLTTIKEKILERKNEYLKAHPEKADDQLIETQRRKHINKRFNVKDKWLPLK